MENQPEADDRSPHEGETQESTERDPAFIYEDPIFQREELLDVDHVPESTDRIVGRDEHIKRIASAINPVLFNSPPTHVIIYGKTGTGKSLIARHITKRLKIEAAKDGTNVHTVRIDCGTRSTETAAVKTLAQRFKPEDSDISIPDSGLSTGDYYDRLWNALEERCDVGFLILDEIDKLHGDEVLRNLSRAGEDNNLTNSSIGIIGISNKIDYPNSLSERVKSSFQYDDIVFKPYDSTQLREILQKRRDAFKEGVLEKGVIPLCSALSANEHGDARKAMDTFRHAGRIAREEGEEVVTEEHVRRGKERAEMNRFNEILRGTPTQGKAVLLALAILADETGEDGHSTHRIFTMYKKIAKEISMSQLSERRVGELLKEQTFLNIIESSRTSRGRGRGMYNEHRLLESPEIVKEVITTNSVFTDLDL